MAVSSTTTAVNGTIARFEEGLLHLKNTSWSKIVNRLFYRKFEEDDNNFSATKQLISVNWKSPISELINLRIIISFTKNRDKRRSMKVLTAGDCDVGRWLGILNISNRLMEIWDHDLDIKITNRFRLHNGQRSLAMHQRTESWRPFNFHPKRSFAYESWRSVWRR